MIVRVADYTFPDDLIQLQRDFDAADRDCVELSTAMPSGVEIVEGNVGDMEEQQAALNEARARRLELAVTLQGHPFWEGVDNRFEAKDALRRAARQ
jgi:hypothetical protein